MVVFLVVRVKKEQVKLLLLGCDDGTIEIFEVPTLSLVATINSHFKSLSSTPIHQPHIHWPGGLVLWYPHSTQRQYAGICLRTSQVKCGMWQLGLLFIPQSVRVMCCLWHPTMTGTVLTAGCGGVLHCWDSGLSKEGENRALPKRRMEREI